MWSMFLAKCRKIAAGSKCIPWRLLSAQALRRVHTHAPVSPLSQQTKRFRESRPLPTKLDVACKNAAHKCLAVWGRLVAAWLRTPSIDRSTPYWFSIIGPTARAWLRRRTRTARQLDTPPRRWLPWNYDTNRRPRTGFLNAQKHSTIRTCDIRQIALRLQLQRQRRVSLSGPPPSKNA